MSDNKINIPHKHIPGSGETKFNILKSSIMNDELFNSPSYDNWTQSQKLEGLDKEKCLRRCIDDIDDDLKLENKNKNHTCLYAAHTDNDFFLGEKKIKKNTCILFNYNKKDNETINKIIEDNKVLVRNLSNETDKKLVALRDNVTLYQRTDSQI